MANTDFELLSSTSVTSLGLELRRYQHQGTGARHYHFDSADSHNAFMVAFPTLPQDSTGVAHILEHTTLCGSERYPVRDPFFMMLRRSLNTFMNAFTSGDSTAYPFATQNRKDFDNLLSVYLDAVFFPRLDPLDFAQEGWRLELSDSPDDDGPRLEYHGVVYNEMKGAMSSPVAQLWQHTHSALFPDAVYRHNSGGDPMAIPNLHYDALRAFHKKHYHPGNAVFMTYGSFPEAEHQQRFAELVLDRFEATEEVIVSAPQAPFDLPRELVATYDIDELEPRNTHIVWAWVIGDTAKVEDFVNAQFLSSLLLEHSASPLRHYLEITALAKAPSELCGVDDSACQLVFICGVEGSEAVHAEAFEAGLFDILDQITSEHPGAAELTAIVDRLELVQRDIGSGTYPFGLQLMGRVLPAALYRSDPEPLLDLTPALERLRRNIADPDFVARLVRENLIDNRHRVRVVMRPEENKAAADEAAERRRLEDLKRDMNAADVERVVAQTEAMRSRQAQEDDPEILPKVTLGDVPPPVPAPVAKIAQARGFDIFEYECPTNGIFRIQVAFDLPDLSPDELRALPLLCEYLTEFGHGDDDYLAVQSRRALTGSYATHALARARIDSKDSMLGWLVIAGKGLARKRDDIINETLGLLHGARFDEHDRLRELIAQSRAEAEQSITDHGHHLAICTAARSLSVGGALDDLWDGPGAIRYVQYLANLKVTDAEFKLLFPLFESMRVKFLAAPRRILLIGEDQALADAAALCEAMMPTRAGASGDFLPKIVPFESWNGWSTSSLINFCAKAYPGPAESSPDVPALAVLGRYLQDGFLHGEIREKGGAYGSGAGYDPDACVFRFFSYRDPRTLATLADFDAALDWFAGDRDPRRLEESILGTIRALDQPRSPSGEAERAFFNVLYGRDDAFRAALRDQVLAVTHEALQRVAAAYLDPSRACLGVISNPANQAEFEQAGLKFGKL